MCTNDPDIGRKSKYCSEHFFLDTNSKEKPEPVAATTQIDIRPQTRAWTKKMLELKALPCIEEDNGPIGCREEQNIKKYYDRTAGLISIVRGCDIRLGTIESYTKESASQLVMALVDRFGVEPNQSEIKCVIADVACGLSKFLDERGKMNETLKKYSELDFVVDSFHVKTHKKKECQPGEKFHPSHPKFSYLEGTHFEAAETSFVALNKCKQMLNKMTGARRIVFIMLLEDVLNDVKEQEIKKKGKLEVSGSALGWRNTEFDYEGLYEGLRLYKGKLPGHSSATIIPVDEISNSNELAIVDPSQFEKLKFII